MSSSVVQDCPSCGGQSLSQTADGGALVCDDCDEQFQGFRAEELDEEYASRMTVFRRTSQSSRAERKRLFVEAEDARTALKLSASQSQKVDSSRLISEGVVIISRAIVDALVAGDYVPKEICSVCFKVISHWIRMCHVGAAADVGISLNSFSASSILAFVCLAAVFVRSSLLPRDLCVLAVQRRIPFLTAGTDLLQPHFLQVKAVREALVPSILPRADEIARLGSTFATSEFAWPPLKSFFNGEAILYKHWAYSTFPLGQYDLTLLRVVRLLGLPDEFCARVRRYRELRRVATAMNVKTHAFERLRRSKRLKRKKTEHFGTDHGDVGDAQGIFLMGNSASKEGIGTDSDAEDRKEGSSSGSTCEGPWPSDTLFDGLGPPLGAPAQSSPELDLAAGLDGSERYLDKKKSTQASRKRTVSFEEELSLHSYELENDISSWPFSATADHRRTLLCEFPTNRTLLVELITTMRICYGIPSLSADIKYGDLLGCSDQDEFDTSCSFAREWNVCLRRMRSVLHDTSSVTEAISWTGLSPTGIDCIRGAPLFDFLKICSSSIQGSMPLFMNEHAEQFVKLGAKSEARDGLVVATDLRTLLSKGSGVDRDLGQSLESSLPFDDVKLTGRWVSDNDSRSHDAMFSTTGAYDADIQKRAKREPLLLSLGHNSDEMRRHRVRRRVFRKVVNGKNRVWADPEGIDFALIIVQRFFLGSFANVGKVSCESPVASDELHKCLDSAIRVVFDYVNIQLAEKGRIRQSVS